MTNTTERMMKAVTVNATPMAKPYNSVRQITREIYKTVILLACSLALAVD
jgi:hypothetical protein